jgi:hypothetical protein
MQGLELTWKRLLSVYWLLTWRWVLGSVVIGVVFGAVIGAVIGLVNGVAISASGARVVPDQVRGAIFFTVGWIAGVGWGFFVLRMALQKTYADFRIVLVPRVDLKAAQTLTIAEPWKL